ncbi:MAG: flagellar type III secretion system protein FliR [Bacillaceae bacterium]|nr:flagellar type III secretion system protein FliR [Bacillaceae bacterium]
MVILEFLPVFLLVFVRMSAFILAAPVFSTRGVPNTFKIGLAFFLSLIAVFAVNMTVDPAEPIAFDGRYVLLILKEVLVGLSLGFIAMMLIYAVQIAGGLIDMQIGFAIANVIDPQTGMHSPLTGNFKFILAILLLLSLDGHHMLIKGIITSYYAVPVDVMWQQLDTGSIARFAVNVFVYMFSSAFMMAAPVVGSLFLVDVALGIMARTVPQMNIFVVGLPLKIFVSFAVLFVALPGYFYILKRLFEEMYRSMAQLMKLLGGS